MTIDPHICYKAWRARDTRFDGRIFVGVKSTGVFCRPICPAPMPKFENCTFYNSAAAAFADGYRPCLRCRPEAAPHTPYWAGTGAVVRRAMRLIDEGYLNERTVADLAAALGLGERHLRNLFAKHVGASPVHVAQTRRLLLAKRLIDETAMSMTDIAFAAGYGSLRRFNHTFKSTYGRTPSQLRQARLKHSGGQGGGCGGASVHRLAFRPPYNWPAMLGFLSMRAIPGVEAVEGSVYRRILRLGGDIGAVEISLCPGSPALTARIFSAAPVPLMPLIAQVRAVFDLEADSERIDGCLRRDARLSPAIDHYPGVRVPGAWDAFELCVRAIIGQQISVAGARTILGRIAGRYGERIAPPIPDCGLDLMFPGPERLAEADLDGVGIPQARRAAIRAAAKYFADGIVSPEILTDAARLCTALCDIPGIGPWTANYVAMRVCRDPDVLLETDLGVQKGLGGENRPGPKDVIRIAEAWRPWRSYGVMYAWQSLAAP